MRKYVRLPCPYQPPTRWYCCIAIIISVTTVIIQIHVVQTRFSPWRHEERDTQIIKAYANHSLLTQHPTCSPSWSLPVETQTDLLFRSEKNQPRASTVETQVSPFQNPQNSQDHLFRAWRHPPTQFTPTAVQPHFQSESLLCGWWLLYPFRSGVRLHHLTMASELRDTE